jgi:hypothetical protein
MDNTAQQAAMTRQILAVIAERRLNEGKDDE